MLTHVDKSLKEYVCLHADGIAYRREYLLNYFDISKDEMKVALFTTWSTIAVISAQKHVHVENVVVLQMFCLQQPLNLIEVKPELEMLQLNKSMN